MELGIISLSDIYQGTTTTDTPTAGGRLDDIVHYAELADQLGLDVFGLGEHHTLDFAVSSPAVALAAIAARTSRIRLASAVSVLPVLDPVRLYQDFATLDLVSHGRAEIVAGRSAFTEPFALFGYDLNQYDALFSEKLNLLLRLREEETITWQGRFRSPLIDAPIAPRALQQPLPVWVGVGGTPQSAHRAGTLGLPMVLGLIGGPIERARAAVDIYREAGDKAGHGDRLRVGVSTHFYAGADARQAREVFPYYHEYLRPKTPGGRGFQIDRWSFEHGTRAGQALVIGSSEEIVDKIGEMREVLGIDRFYGQVDWGGLPRELIDESITRLATEIAPVIRGM
jgi:alkanesulfonate monooxygenase SsuD/methylene tetrahydromethanopterin reductase-like flavin-dependent oxidoreductase (luciferase family)